MAKAAGPLRVYNAVDAAKLGRYSQRPAATPDGRITTRAIKLYMDGLGSRGAAVRPYSDAPTSAARS
jgi:hypothetical protein